MFDNILQTRDTTLASSPQRLTIVYRSGDGFRVMTVFLEIYYASGRW